MGPVSVQAVAASVTFPLRQQVLRPHQRVEEMTWPGDDDQMAWHVAARTEDGTVVSVASVRPEPPPWAPGPSGAWRLRGMATAEGWRGRQVGAQVLDAVVGHVAAQGGGLLWCNARQRAVPFYLRAGLVTRGQPWVEPDIGPHIAMEMQVAPATR